MAEKDENSFVDENPSQLREFESWISEQKNLPQNNDKILLLRFLNVYEGNDLKKAQDLFLFNLDVRKNSPHLFTNRDVMSEEIQQANKVMQFCPMSKLTAEKCKITVVRLANDDASQFYYVNIVKMFLMMFDVCFTDYDDVEGNISSGEFFVIDGRGFSFRHFVEVARNIQTVRVYMKYIQEAAPFNIKSIHFVNCSAILDKVFSLIKPLLKKDLMNSIFFHKSGLESLHQHVPKYCLPSEYGGDLESINDLHRKFSNRVETMRSYLLNNNNWAIDI